MYDQETVRNRKSPSNQSLKTMVGRHIDQMVRTRNFKARNERIETGVLVKSYKGRKVSVERKMGECCQWKATGQCARGDSCSVGHGTNRGQRAQSCSLAPKAQTQTDGRKPSKGSGHRGKKPILEEKAGKRVKKSSKESVRLRRVIIGILPYVKITSLYRDANSATTVFSDTLRLMGSREAISKKPKTTMRKTTNLQ